jgi:hypothetical protein
MSQVTRFDNIDWNDIEEMSDEEYNNTFFNNTFFKTSFKSQETSSSDEWTEIKKPKKTKKQIEMYDKQITCKKCSNAFDFRVDQQLKYKNANWEEPKICWHCQKSRFQERSKQ